MAAGYDLVVIGGGSGGIAAANRAASYGARCAVIEAGPLGGTCVNVGCVPKKMMWNAAHLQSESAIGVGSGTHRGTLTTDWPALVKAREAYIERLNGLYGEKLASNKVEVLHGHGEFVDATTIAVGERRMSAKHILIATGGRPTTPHVPGAELGIDSDGFFALREQPRNVAIVGSGYIAAELAGMLQGMGSAVTVIMRGERILSSFDATLGNHLMGSMRAQGIEIVVDAKVESISRDTDNNLTVTRTGAPALTGFDTLIWAVGRTPNTRGLHLPRTGIEVDAQGFIPVNENQETVVASIYAVGDVTVGPALTPVAIAAGRGLADRLFGGKAGWSRKRTKIPTVIFTHPPIGTIGMTQADAEARLEEVRVYHAHFTPLVYALSPHPEKTTMKLITAGEDEKIVGCHVIGPGADEMLQGFAVAIQMGATKRDFDATLAIHPTSAEELITLR